MSMLGFHYSRQIRERETGPNETIDQREQDERPREKDEWRKIIVRNNHTAHRCQKICELNSYYRFEVRKLDQTRF